jgi:uncharacterized protein
VKLSKYNFFYNKKGDPDSIIAFNAVTCALALIDKSDFEELMRFEKGEINQLGNKFANELHHGRFIVEDSIDEKKILKYRQLISRYNTNGLGLTIAPTLGCNFRCIYCYESTLDKYQKMDADVQGSVIQLIENHIKFIDSLYIAWYGGEPTLAMDVVEPLSERIIKICNENNVKYDASMITNGYLMTEGLAKKLNSLKVSQIQITIDGPKEIHDERRKLVNGEGTFDTIVSNIKKSSKFLNLINLRINLDKANEGQLSNMFKIFSGFDPNVHPYLGRVDNANGRYGEDKCFETSRFSEINKKFKNSLSKNTQQIVMQGYPTPIGRACGADALNSMIIAPNGDLCKCWNDIGLEGYCIGNIKNMLTLTPNAILLDYALYDPTEDELCSECKFLPFCMGGCPRKRLDGVERCNIYKYNIGNYLTGLVDELTKTSAG